MEGQLKSLNDRYLVLSKIPFVLITINGHALLPLPHTRTGCTGGAPPTVLFQPSHARNIHVAFSCTVQYVM